MRIKYIILSIILCCTSIAMYAQEDNIRTDSIIMKEHAKPVSSEIYHGHDAIAPELHGVNKIPDLRGVDLKLFNPMEQPVIKDQNPMFLGDYSSGGLLFNNIYAAGSQESIPGIGRINRASFTYFMPLGEYFDFQAGVNAATYNINHVGNTFGVSGMLTYHPNDVLSFSMFGSYADKTPFGINDRRYGGTVGYKVNEKFKLEMGVQRVYDPMKRKWETVPIFIPSYKIGNVELGLDVGALIYEILQHTVFDKHKNQNNMIIPPPQM